MIKSDTCWYVVLALGVGVIAGIPTPAAGEPAKTSTEWRNDEANLDAVRLINEAYERLPFSREYEGVLDEPPLRMDWAIGPNVPVAWKGGVTGIIGNQIILTGGLWMPQRANLTYVYYAHVGVMPYGVATSDWVSDGKRLFSFGGEPAHSYNRNTENVLQIGTIRWRR